MKYTVRIWFLFIFSGLSATLFSQQKDSIPPTKITFDGTLKTKMEWNLNAGEIRFNLRNSRVGFRGNIGAYVDFRVQVELNNEGKFDVLDGYGTVKPFKNFCINVGQTAVPFENLYLITPSEMMFANRTFIGKFFSPGSRDLGLSAMYKIGNVFPVTMEGGVFNGGKINAPQWTDNPSYAFRVTAGSVEHFKTSVKMYRYPCAEKDWLLLGADISYRKNNLLLQAEVMNRHNYNDSISHNRNFSGAYIQSSYTIPCNFGKMFHCLIPALRWDAMSYDFFGDGLDVNRLTLGLACGLNTKPCTSLIRIDFEQYFLRNELPELATREEYVSANKITVELLLKF